MSQFSFPSFSLHLHKDSPSKRDLRANLILDIEADRLVQRLFTLLNATPAFAHNMSPKRPKTEAGNVIQPRKLHFLLLEPLSLVPGVDYFCVIIFTKR